MYSNSKARIKLLNKMSDVMDILTGTEQGHPMSPELFKCYLLDLSTELDSLTNLNIPELNGIKLSHLLWADDLVLLALDGPSLQRLIEAVHDYCSQWGLTVNIAKTEVMVFNKSGKQLKESYGFIYGNTIIPSTKEYCYLGITFVLSGSYAKTQDELRKKGLRAYFSLKKLLDLKNLSTQSIFKLFDSLIVPIISYGCSVWLYNTNFFKLLASGKLLNDTKNSMRRIALDPIERIHLKLLKWTILVNKKAANIPCWGDSGRVPLVIKHLKQTFDFYRRLEILDHNNINSLARHTFVEQRNHALPWYNEMQSFLHILNLTTETSSTVISSTTKEMFEGLWYKAMQSSSKLKFYIMIKSSIGYEPYLSLNNIKKRRSVARLRFSSHNLNIETGRYIWRYAGPKMNTTQEKIVWKKCCGTCSTDNAELLLSLPFADPIYEDEHHVLVSCPKYDYLRHQLNDQIKSALLCWEDESIKDLFAAANINNFSSYIHRIFESRDSEMSV